MKINTTYRNIFLCTAMAICFSNCKKKSPALVDTIPVTSTSPTEYIRAKVNGTLVEATYKFPNSDVVSNPYHSADQRFQMERYVSSSTSQGYEIFLQDLDLDHITYPTTIRQTNLSGDPYPEMIYNNGNSGADGNFLINNLDSTLFSITFSSFNNDVLQGSFSGKLRWGSNYDSTLTFTDGEFKIKLIRY